MNEDESCFEKLYKQALAMGEIESFKEYVCDSIRILSSMTEFDKALSERWMAERVH